MASHAIVLQLPRAMRCRLQQLRLKTRHKVVFRRYQIVLQLANGDRPSAIAEGLGCDVSTVYRTRQAFLRRGEASLPPRKSPGRPRRVTKQQECELDQALAREPRALGKNFSNWTAPNLKVHLHWTVQPVTVWRYLRRLKWRWHRPVPRVASPDRRYSAKARYLRRLRAQARRGEIHLYYADEMDVALLPTIGGRWMRQGQQTQVNTPGKRQNSMCSGPSTM